MYGCTHYILNFLRMQLIDSSRSEPRAFLGQPESLQVDLQHQSRHSDLALASPGCEEHWSRACKSARCQADSHAVQAPSPMARCLQQSEKPVKNS